MNLLWPAVALFLILTLRTIKLPANGNVEELSDFACWPALRDNALSAKSRANCSFDRPGNPHLIN